MPQLLAMKISKNDWTAPPDWDDFFVTDRDGRRLSPWMSRAQASLALSVLEVVQSDAASFYHALASLAAHLSPDKEKERHAPEYWAAFLQETPPRWPSTRMPCEVEPGEPSYWAQQAREHDRLTAQADAEAEADFYISKSKEL